MNKLEQLINRRSALAAEMKTILNDAKARNFDPYQSKFASKKFLDVMGGPSAELDSVMRELIEHEMSMSGPEHFSKENVFIWGGPTPQWGGSMDKDTSLKAAKYFGLDNVMYVYGPMNDEMISLHKKCGKLICHLGRNCRTKGAAAASDADEALELSRLSLKYQNIIGGVVDDMTGNYGPSYSHREYKLIYDNLKAANPDLELYGVVYTRELDDKKELLAVRDCIDHVILWVWDKSDLIYLDMNIEKCRAIFPGRKIMLGIFMFDYGVSCLPAPPDLIEFHLKKAKKYLAEGKVHDMVILGDREIEKCPDTAKLIKKFLKREFAER